MKGARYHQLPSFPSNYILIQQRFLKGMNILVDAGLIEKHRGRGMFVRTEARQKIMEERKESFYKDYVKTLLVEAHKLGINKQHLVELIERGEHDGTIKD